METTDLRRGNWLYGSYNGFGKEIQIYDFDRKDIQHTDENQNPIPVSNFKPILLTEDWLKRFGFIKVGYNFEKKWLLLHTNRKTGTFDFLLNEPFSKKMHITTIKYVHQLQNLYYYLSNYEELELKFDSETSKSLNAKNNT